MKPILENIAQKRGQHSLVVFELNQHSLDFFWHYHPEYELTLIIEGKGRRLIGDNHELFESGDLVLLGPGLPHTWVSDNGIAGTCKVIVIQFTLDFIERFAGLDELSQIHKLLSLSDKGISFNQNNSPHIQDLIQSFPSKYGVEKLTHFLHILEELSNLNTTCLASSLYQPLKGNENELRINKVCQFVQKNSSDSLTIHEAAALIHLTPSAFCKFFKRMTGITFSEYVNDIRIANVCNQLIVSDKQVGEIAYENGFETLTYFNRIFLRKKHMRPSMYRKKFKI